MLETNPVNEDYDGMVVDEVKVVVPKTEKVQMDDDIVRCNVKVTRKFLKEYNALCKKKGMTRSKRLRNFMEFELRKDEVAKAEAKRIEEAAAKAEEVIFDPFADNSNE